MWDIIWPLLVLLVRESGQVFAVTFGYGNSLLKEEDIQRNFGLKVALNTIDPKRIRSMNTASIEDMVVASQTQASHNTSQDQFDINTFNNVLRGVMGVPADEAFGRTMYGKDALKVSVLMRMTELKEKLRAYYKKYISDLYKQNGFDWIDNINEVKDPVLQDGLAGELITRLNNRKLSEVTVSPPDTVDWSMVSGMRFSGMRTKEFSDELNFEDYLSSAREINLSKLKRDKIIVCDLTGNEFPACSVFLALTTQIEYENRKYILCAGIWYLVEKSFYDKVINFADRNVNRSSIAFPICNETKEEDFNLFIASNSDEFCCLDRVLFAVDGGPKQIEACDLFSKTKQFVHVKMKNRSSQLSHLFWQGRVSAECFLSDSGYRKNVIEAINKRFGLLILSPDEEVIASDFEVVFAIVTKERGKISESIPFFSSVTLMQTVKALELMNIRCSIAIIDQEAQK